MSSLASIQVIEALNSIPGADRIEEASILGWKCVVRKGSFKVGDACVYISVDSIVPPYKPFAFLGEHRRIKTMRLRGMVSQGLAMPLADFEQESLAHANMPMLEVGTDVTDLLGIIKYEKTVPAAMQGLVKSTFPKYVPITDEERIQNCRDVLNDLKGEKVYITTKLDGTSCTFIIKDNEFDVCSRRLTLKRPEVEVTIPDAASNMTKRKDAYWEMAEKYDIEQKLTQLSERRKSFGFSGDLAIQGEIVGDGIQGNPLGLSVGVREFRVFSVYSIAEQKYLGYNSMMNIVKDLDLTPVPLVSAGKTLEELGLIDIDNFVSYLDHKYEGTNTPIEGMVFRPMEQKDNRYGNISFKVINPKYELEVEA